MSEGLMISGVLGGFGLIITIVYNVKNTALANHKMHKELFTEFNKRYNDLNEGLNTLGTTPLAVFNDLVSDGDKDKSKNLIYDFFNLCAEEYYWKRNNRIPKKVWRSWERGMNDIYNRSEVIRYFWDEECKNDGYISYYLDRKDELFNLR